MSKTKLTRRNRLFNDNGYLLNSIIRTLRQRPLPTPENTTAETPQLTCRPLPYVQGVSELIASYLRPYNLNIAHKPTESLRKTLMHVKDPLPTQTRRNVVNSIPCCECPSPYVGQTGRQFATLMKEYESGVRTRIPFWPYIASQPATRLIGPAPP